MTHANDGPDEALRKTTERYRREKRRAADIERKASSELAQAIRTAYEGGMKKADIIRAIDHVWSRTWVDRACKGDEPARVREVRRG